MSSCWGFNTFHLETRLASVDLRKTENIQRNICRDHVHPNLRKTSWQYGDRCVGAGSWYKHLQILAASFLSNPSQTCGSQTRILGTSGKLWKTKIIWKDQFLLGKLYDIFNDIFRLMRIKVYPIRLPFFFSPVSSRRYTASAFSKTHRW